MRHKTRFSSHRDDSGVSGKSTNDKNLRFLFKWKRENTSLYGGKYHYVTWRGFWGYLLEQACEKAFDKNTCFQYGYRNNLEDFYRFGGVGALEHNSNEKITRSWKNNIANYKGE
jgi:hypothetical protein